MITGLKYHQIYDELSNKNVEVLVKTSTNQFYFMPDSFGRAILHSPNSRLKYSDLKNVKKVIDLTNGITYIPTDTFWYEVTD